MGERRIRTHELLELLELTVPTSAIRVSEVAVCVGFHYPLVAFERHGDGWIAIVVRVSADASGGSWCVPREDGAGPCPEFEEGRQFVGFEEALELLNELWPVTEHSTSAILGDTPADDAAVDAALAIFRVLFALRGLPEPPEFRHHEKSELAERAHAEVRKILGEDKEEGGGHVH